LVAPCRSLSSALGYETFGDNEEIYGFNMSNNKEFMKWHLRWPRRNPWLWYVESIYWHLLKIYCYTQAFLKYFVSCGIMRKAHGKPLGVAHATGDIATLWSRCSVFPYSFGTLWSRWLQLICGPWSSSFHRLRRATVIGIPGWWHRNRSSSKLLFQSSLHVDGCHNLLHLIVIFPFTCGVQ